jgi:L-histidine Nalpha-methyltransferase
MLEIRSEMPETQVGASPRASLAMLSDVKSGIIDRGVDGQRTLPAKYFYDHRGSELFEQITRLPEYYLTRTERALLAVRMPEWTRQMRPRALVELGAGNADKTRTILDAMRRSAVGIVYVPVDVSATFLDETARRLRDDYPDVQIRPLVADFATGARISPPLPRPILSAFLGSTIGNLADDEATRMFGWLRETMDSDDRLLLGADLVKDPALIEAAYNDSRGITAAFNRNMLVVLNRELGADFDPRAFAHRAFFDARAGRIEMHLVATSDQIVRIPGLPTAVVPRGDSIRTEISNKYTRERLSDILESAGLEIATWETDDAGGYALVLAARHN